MFQAEEVKRDEWGWWLHSALRRADEEDIALLPEAADAELAYVEFYGDAPVELERMYERGVSLEGDEEEAKQAIRDWQPTPPKGEGWMLIGIYDTEDGPRAAFAKQCSRPAQSRRCPGCGSRLVYDDNRDDEGSVEQAYYYCPEGCGHAEGL